MTSPDSCYVQRCSNEIITGQTDLLPSTSDLAANSRKVTNSYGIDGLNNIAFYGNHLLCWQNKSSSIFSAYLRFFIPLPFFNIISIHGHYAVHIISSLFSIYSYIPKYTAVIIKLRSLAFDSFYHCKILPCCSFQNIHYRRYQQPSYTNSFNNIGIIIIQNNWIYNQMTATVK